LIATGNCHAQQAWKEFHDDINAAGNSAVKQIWKGFYIDLHSQSHPMLG